MAMNDRQKLVVLFTGMGIRCYPKDNGFAAGGRRYYFNGDGEIERITDYYEKEGK